MTEPVRTASRREPIDHAPEPSSPAVRGARPNAPSAPPAAVSALHDQAVRDFARQAASSNDRITYLGMNGASARSEVTALARRADVELIAHGRDWTVKVAGHAYDLASEQGRASFVALLRAQGLPPTAEAGMKALLATPSTGIDEIAYLALAWVKGERGEPVPSRLVVSGHSSGVDVWDENPDGHGTLELDLVRKLAALMPRAAAQIEDVQLAGCSTAAHALTTDGRADWLEAFPNLKTIWGYDGSSPLAAVRDLAVWESATRGPSARVAEARAGASRNVVVWDRETGARGKAEPLAAVRDRQRTAESRFDAWASGRRAPASSDDAELVRDYRTYRALAAREDVPLADRRAAERRAEVLLRVRYFEAGVRRGFARTHGAEVRRAHQRLGIPAPDFATLSRADALRAIERFEQAARRQPSAEDERALAALRGLRDLDRAAIPAGWCTH